MSAAFDVVFGVFALAIVALAVVAIRWGIQRDRVARARQAESPAPPPPPSGTDAVSPGSNPNGNSS